jgi:uncharacterized protein DUF3858/transglutaminase superfamily protein
MHLKKLTCIIAFFLLLQNHLQAQDKSYAKFGKVTAADFDLSKYNYDSSAAAVIMADIGNTSFTGNAKGDFTLVFKRFTRIKILNKNGYDAASGEIMVYRDGMNGEELADLKASTFNIENGNVTETRLDAKSVFTDKIDKYYSNKKFTMPAVKEGSIVDISYTIKSDYYNFLRSWDFQGKYPCLWSEYEVVVPQFFHYVFFNQGDQHYFINTSKTVAAFYSIRESGGTSSDDVYNINSSAFDYRWVMKDVPVLKEENYTSSLSNYIARIEFQLHYIQYTESSERHDRMGNYFMASEKLLKDDDFGADLDKDNGWMDDELKSITAGCTSSLEKMKKIYCYVRDHFTCTAHSGKYIATPIKTVFKNKNGSTAEINLLMIAMLRHASIDADPVILGTRDYRHTNDTYPLMNRFNYVICVAKDEGKDYLLDASRAKLGFGKLDDECYNGGAREVNKERPYLINLSPDSLKEAKLTTVFITNDEKNTSELSGTFTSTLGNVESYDLRVKISKKTEEDYFKNIKSYSSDYKITNTGIDSLAQLDMPATVHYDFAYKISSDNDIIYFNPMFSEGYKENPFKSAERKYPVEMPYVMDETYVLNMEIPNGYVVDEIPKSARVLLNGNEGSFEYIIQKDETNVQMRSRIKLNKATFEPDDYSTLRDFFAFIVKQQSEQIVFKKKK